MVIPLPAMPLQMGPPSEYAKSRKLLYSFLLSLLTICIVLRIYPGLDIMGGFIHGIGVGLGWYAVSREMDIQFVCYCGMLNFINGIFDGVKTIDYAVHQGLSFGGSPTRSLLSAILIASPILMLWVSALSYWIYKDYDRMTLGPAQFRDEERAPLASRRGGSGSSGRGFAAFQGEGQRLGST